MTSFDVTIVLFAAHCTSHLKPMKSGHLVSHEVFYLMRHGVAELMRHKVYEVCLCKKG